MYRHLQGKMMSWYIYIYATSCNVLLILCYSINSYAGIFVTGNRLTNILNIHYSCISAYTVTKQMKLTSNKREKKGRGGGVKNADIYKQIIDIPL